jgi:toxin HigB-1
MKIAIKKSARKALEKAPAFVQDKLDTWLDAVRETGLQEARKIPAFHDEPLSGKRQGQRSIRLSLHWRCIYEETEMGILLTLLEVTHHDYRTR